MVHLLLIWLQGHPWLLAAVIGDSVAAASIALIGVLYWSVVWRIRNFLYRRIMGASGTLFLLVALSYALRAYLSATAHLRGPFLVFEFKLYVVVLVATTLLSIFVGIVTIPNIIRLFNLSHDDFKAAELMGKVDSQFRLITKLKNRIKILEADKKATAVSLAEISAQIDRIVQRTG